MTEQAQLNVTALIRRFATEDQEAIEKYTQDKRNWSINSALRAACIPAQSQEPQPIIPTIHAVLPSLAGEIFEAYEAHNVEVETGWRMGQPTLVSVEPDYTSAIILTQYVPPAPRTPVVLSQPDNPLGKSMGGGKRAPAGGDTSPIGRKYPDDNGDVWVKTSDETPFGPAVYYKRSTVAA